jgi:hypothetical protein
MTTDVFEHWFRTAGRPNAQAWSPTRDLYRSYCHHLAALGGDGEKGIQAFSRRLGRTLIKNRKRRGRGWLGYELRSSR